jgi:membrane protein implicated in regulation of membrane protease activity
LTVVRTLKKLLLGETWLLPLGLAAAAAATLVIRQLLGSPWHQVGGFVLLGAVAAVVVVSVSRSAGRR